MVLPDNICRLCASSGNRCVPVFSSEGDKNLLQHKLRICSPVIVKEGDLLPKQVCLNCLSSLDQIYEFYQSVKSAQHRLLAMMEINEQQKGHTPNANKNEASRRLCFGSTVITYGASGNDNVGKGPEQTQNSPLFVVVRSTEGSDKRVANDPHYSLTQDSTKHLESKSPVSSETNPNHTTSPHEKKVVPNDTSQSSKEGCVKQEPLLAQKGPLFTKAESEMKRSSTSSSNSSEKTKLPTPSPTLGEEKFKTCQHCQREFPEHILPDHEALHKGKKVYSCTECSVGFISEMAFKRHFQKHHRNQVLDSK